MNHETGADLLIETIRQMRLTQDSWMKEIAFEVTGKGESLKEFEFLASIDSFPKVILHGRLSDSEYQAVLNRTDVGLSLKLNNGLFANTTFPSKVIEYGAAGLLVMTTDISDVRNIFGNSAIYLTCDNPIELMQLFKFVASNRKEAQVYAHAGHQVVKNICQPNITGKSIADFIFG